MSLKHLQKPPRYSYEHCGPWCNVAHPQHVVNDVLLTTCVGCLSALIRERSHTKAAAGVDIEMALAVMRGLSVQYEPDAEPSAESQKVGDAAAQFGE